MRIATGANESGLPAAEETVWEDVFCLAEQHHVLPMIVDAAYRVYGNDIPWDRLSAYKKRARQMTYLQAVKTQRFLSLYRSLAGHGLKPLVLKGLICRELYPNPDFRFSADEDLLIPPDQAQAYYEAITAYGLKTESSAQSAASEQETPYRSEDGVLFLEVHRFVFPPESGAYGEYNKYFENAYEHAVTVSAAGADISTMAPTDHLLYLICHALKHFLHGGFGIRQICDIGLYAKAYAEQIEWTRLMEQTASIRAKDFAASLFAIAQEALGIDLTRIPEELHPKGIDTEALLDDILESGIYGSSTMSRKHSATMTLRAAETAHSGTSGKKHSVTRTLFPPAASLVKRYPYLAERPWLLPAAWLQRIFRYIRARTADDTPAEALRIGHGRISLMKKYGILSEPPAKQVDTGEYLAALCGLIDEGHEVAIPVAGSSMTPFLGDGRDQVFVKKPWRPIRRGDIVLYRRGNGDFVLHRVYRVQKKGNTATYDLIGDAQKDVERGIQREQIFAVATRAKRKGKIIGSGNLYWWFFRYIWIRIIPLRRMLIQSYAVLNKMVH